MGTAERGCGGGMGVGRAVNCKLQFPFVGPVPIVVVPKEAWMR